MDITNINVVLNTTENNQSVGVKLAWLTGDKEQSVFVIELNSNEFIPAHYHKISIESYFILSGKGIIHLGRIMDEQLMWQQQIEVKAGDCFSIPPNQVHQFENNSTHKLRLIGIAPLTHSTDEDRFFV